MNLLSKKRVISHFQYAIGFNQQELSRVLHIDARTIQRYKKDEQAPLPIEVSDRVVALASLLVKGLEVFEDKYAEDLTGEEAYRFGGRWNSAGIRCLYTAESMALTAWETYVHIKKNRPMINDHLWKQP